MCTGLAPYDPFFYLHHAYIDLLWQQWQDSSLQHKYAYYGTIMQKLDWFGDHIRKHDNSVVEGIEDANLYNNNDFADVTVEDTMLFQAIKDPNLDAVLLQVSTEDMIDGSHAVFVEESQEVKDVANNIARMMHETAAAHVEQHNQAQLAKHKAKHASAAAGSAGAVLLEAMSSAVSGVQEELNKVSLINVSIACWSCLSFILCLQEVAQL
jgi:hypothetical protein